MTSQETPSPNPDDSKGSGPNKPAKAKKPKKPGRWKRRAIWTLCLLLIGGVTLRAVLPLALPTVIRKVAGVFGMTCSYDRFELNMFSGDAGIWGLQFLPKEGGPAIMTADYCHGNVSVLDLFKGKLNVWRIEADGVDVNIDRNPDGHIPLLDRFVTATASSTTKPVEVNKPAIVTTPPNAPAGQVNLASPLRIDALRLGHIHVHIHDRGISPQLDTELAMDLRLSDLGSTTTPAKFEMNLSADPLMDSMKVTGEGHSGGKNLDASLKVLVRGIRLKPAAAYLTPLGIRPVSDGITLTAEGTVHTQGAPNGAEGFTGSIAFDHLSAVADRQEALALDHLKIDAGVIDTKSIHFNSFIMDGARATAGRAADGNLQIAGIEYDPKLVAQKPPSAPAPASAASAPSPLLTAILAEHWSVGEIALKNAQLQLHDQGISPAVNLALIVDELSAKSIDHDPKNLETAVTLHGAMRSPGLVQQISLEGGATPFAAQKKLYAELSVIGIKPDAIKPYLDQLGVESTLKNGDLQGMMNATLAIGHTAEDKIVAGMNAQFAFRDQGQPLLGRTSVQVTNATLEPKTGSIRVADIELSGPAISVLRDKAGQLSALGFRTNPAVTSLASNNLTATAAAKPPLPMATTQSAVVTGPSTTIASLPRISVDRLGWHHINLNFEDDTITPPQAVTISDITFSASDLSTDLTSTRSGHFKASLVSPQLAKGLSAEGNLTPRADGLKLDATVTGSGLDTTSIANYLKPLGIEPILRDGGLSFHANADVMQNTSGLMAAVGLDNLKFTAGADELAGIDQVQIAGVSLHNSELGIDLIEIVHPRASARREADGSLVAGGIRVLPSVPANPNANTVIAPPASSASRLPTSAPIAAASPASPFVVALKKLTVTDADIAWQDQSISPAVNTTAGTSLELDNFVFGREAEAAQLNLTAHATGSADQLLVTGKVSAAPSGQSAALDITATGLRLGPLAAYLPPGIGSTLKDGRFHTNLEAAVSPNTAGGISAKLIVGPVDFADAGTNAGASLFHLDSVRVMVPRVDLPTSALNVQEISVTGATAHAEKTAAGEIACIGFLIGQRANRRAAPIAVATTQLSPPAAAPAISPVVASSNGPSVKDLIAASHRVLPSVTLDKLEVTASNLTFSDLSRPESAPLVVSELNLHNVNRVDWLGKDAATKPPTKLQFVCKISPLVDHVQVDTAVSPFAKQPTLQIDFAATGVHGPGLTQLVPELKDKLDGSNMSNGTARGHFEAEAKLDRQSPIDFDISRGFDLSFLLNQVQYRARPDGPVLAGVDEVRSENIRIAPADSLVHFKLLEITKPIGLITQDQQGIHALGWVYKLPAATQPAVASTQTAVAADTKKSSSATTVKPAEIADRAASARQRPQSEIPRGELRIDKLLISGLDFRVEDSSVTPPMVIPLNGLDVEVRNFSSLAPYEDKPPIRFSAIVNADKIKLRKKGATTQDLEDRDLFSQITASGEISQFPQLHGWAKSSVSGLDLGALQGQAAKFGENLSAGVYDSNVDLRFDPTGAIAITSKFVLTDLSLSEPPDGLIRRLLKLPAPLDVAIGAVQGADGSIALPLNVSLDPKHISYADLGLAATGGVSQVIVTAIAAAPLKAANDVTGLIGLGGGDKQPEDLTTRIGFAPGSVTMGSDQSLALSSLLVKLSEDESLTITLRHQTGAGDVSLAAVRANPTREQASGLESQLRSRKAELLRLRSDAAGQARANLVSQGATAAEASLQRLKAIDREIAGVEESLDQVGELLKPGAEKSADRRTRTAALKIANDRVSMIQATLIAHGIAADRIKTIAAQYSPAAELDGGQVVITAVRGK